MLAGASTLAMQYSPMCAIPYVAMVDAGTVELVRSLGVDVVSSAELIQHFEARWTAEALESHLEAGRRVDRVRAQAFEMIREITRGGGAVQEFAVAEFVRDGFAKAGLFAEDGPIVGGARDAAIARVKDAVAAGQELRGFEVDDAARGYIASRGYGDYFVHRTGHSIGEEVHGNGANMDNLETHDERRVVPWTCFSIEPGVYLKDFGIRSEVNMFVGATEARVTGEMQTELVIL